jgi:uncharacterized protein (DUF305 family)
MKSTALPLSQLFVRYQTAIRAIFLAGGLLLMAGCDDKDVDVLITQPHDENKMMAIMHEMDRMMEEVTMTNDPDVVFANMMVVHHQGAINMANEELAHGDDSELRAIAQKIITDQQKEIQELQDFLHDYEPDQPADHAFHEEMMASMEKASQAADLRILTGDTDHDFAELMIVHHQAAIEDARSVMEHGTSPEIKEMAHEMINAQMEEIKQLQEWLLAHKKY